MSEKASPSVQPSKKPKERQLLCHQRLPRRFGHLTPAKSGLEWAVSSATQERQASKLELSGQHGLPPVNRADFPGDAMIVIRNPARRKVRAEKQRKLAARDARAAAKAEAGYAPCFQTSTSRNRSPWSPLLRSGKQLLWLQRQFRTSPNPVPKRTRMTVWDLCRTRRRTWWELNMRRRNLPQCWSRGWSLALRKPPPVMPRPLSSLKKLHPLVQYRLRKALLKRGFPLVKRKSFPGSTRMG